MVNPVPEASTFFPVIGLIVAVVSPFFEPVITGMRVAEVAIQITKSDELVPANALAGQIRKHVT